MPTNRRARPPDGSQDDDRLLDGVNRQLLALLSDDARMSIAEMARRVGVSAPTVRDRVARLERAGVIRGYRVDIDPTAVGLPIAAWVRVRPGPGQLAKVAELARRSTRISEGYRITGEDCFLLKVHGRSVEDLESVLDEFLMFGQTTTAIVVATPGPARRPAPQ